MNDPIATAAAAMVALLDSNPTQNDLVWGVTCINAAMYENGKERQ